MGNKTLSNLKEKKSKEIWGAYEDVSPKKLFLNLFNEIPNETRMLVEVDTNTVIRIIRENYLNNEFFYDIFFNSCETPIDEDETKKKYIAVIGDKLIIEYDAEKYLTIYHRHSEEEINIITKHFLSNKKNRYKPFFYIVTKGFGDNLELQPFEPRFNYVDINKNYNDDFQNVDNIIMNFLNNDKSGLIILHGEQGTGKTSYIRSLTSRVKDKKIIFMPAGMMEALTSPSIIPFMMSNKDSILILEDCEQMLKSRDTVDSVNVGLINILNISDGLLGDALKLKFICTFNAPMKSIDKALQRKGRLVARYEFGKLSKEKVASLNKIENIGIPDDAIQDMTLAEIYNYDKDSFVCKKKEIGLTKCIDKNGN